MTLRIWKLSFPKEIGIWFSFKMQWYIEMWEQLMYLKNTESTNRARGSLNAPKASVCGRLLFQGSNRIGIDHVTANTIIRQWLHLYSFQVQFFFRSPRIFISSCSKDKSAWHCTKYKSLLRYWQGNSSHIIHFMEHRCAICVSINLCEEAWETAGRGSHSVCSKVPIFLFFHELILLIEPAAFLRKDLAGHGSHPLRELLSFLHRSL